MSIFTCMSIRHNSEHEDALKDHFVEKGLTLLMHYLCVWWVRHHMNSVVGLGKWPFEKT